MSNTEIPERAFVIAERLKSRQESESTIRAALAEFKLSEKQIKTVLKQVSPDNQFVASPKNLYGKVQLQLIPRSVLGKESIWDTIVESGVRMALFLLAMACITVFAVMILSSGQ